MKVLFFLSMTCCFSLAFGQSIKLLVPVGSIAYLPGSAKDKIVLLPLLKDSPGDSNSMVNAKCSGNSINFLQMTDTAKTMTSQGLYRYYMQKHKTNNIVGFVLLGSGCVIAFIGLKNNLEQLLSQHNDGPGVIITGGAIAMLSIPFLIAGANNKRKAYLSLKTTSAPVTVMNQGSLNYTAVDLKVQF